MHESELPLIYRGTVVIFTFFQYGRVVVLRGTSTSPCDDIYIKKNKGIYYVLILYFFRGLLIYPWQNQVALKI